LKFTILFRKGVLFWILTVIQIALSPYLLPFSISSNTKVTTLTSLQSQHLLLRKGVIFLPNYFITIKFISSKPTGIQDIFLRFVKDAHYVHPSETNLHELYSRPT